MFDPCPRGGKRPARNDPFLASIARAFTRLPVVLRRGIAPFT
jgi:hypothetical protein